MQHCGLSEVTGEFQEDGNYTARADDGDGVFVGLFGDFEIE